MTPIDYELEAYNRYVGIFRSKRLEDEGYAILPLEKWKAAPKQKKSIMPDSLPAFSVAQISTFNKFIDAALRGGWVKAVVQYENGSKWLYMKPGSPDSARDLAPLEYDAMVDTLGCHLFMGHSDRGIDYGRRSRGKHVTIETAEQVKLARINVCWKG